MEKQDKTHIVYIGRYNDRVVYVGQGKKYRHQHLNSGISNVYQANQVHHSGGIIDVEVIPVESSEKSRELESEYITKYEPDWNSEQTGSSDKKRLLRKIINKYPTTLPLNKQRVLVSVMIMASTKLCSNNTAFLNSDYARVTINTVSWTRINSDYHAKDYRFHISREKFPEGCYRYVVYFREEFFDEEFLEANYSRLVK